MPHRIADRPALPDVPAPDMQIVYIPTDQLIPYVGNPRKNDHAVAKAAEIIREFGFRVPVQIRGQGEVVDGHLRIKAAKLLGIERLPCVRVDDMTEAQIGAFRIAVNRMGELAGWDYDLLKIEVGELQRLDYDVKLTGLSDLKLRKLDLALTAEAPPARIPTIMGADLESLAPTDDERAAMAGKKFVMSYSGGMDSGACALWVRRYFPDADLELVFVDLGADFIGFIDHLRAFARAVQGMLTIVRSRENIIDLFYRRGDWPSFVAPYCHEPMHEALHAYFKTYPPGNIVLVRGGRRAEKKASAHARADRWMESPGLPGYRYFQPLYFGDKGTSERICRAADAPIWSGYGRGLCRTACRVCPGQRPRAYAALRREYPEVWEEIRELERALGPGAWNRSFAGLGVIPTFDAVADRGERELAGEADESAEVEAVDATDGP